MVLWLTVLIAVIGSSFAYSMRGEALAARNTMSLAQARAAADGAVERTFFELSRPRVTPEGWWAADGQPHTFNDGDVSLTVVAYDESARIDLNSAAEPLLKGLLQNVGGLDPETAQRTLEAILDWRDPDDLRRPNGAEAQDYQSAGSKYVPTNSPFESVGEYVFGKRPVSGAQRQEREQGPGLAVEKALEAELVARSFCPKISGPDHGASRGRCEASASRHSRGTS